MKLIGLSFTQIPLGLTISGGLIRRIFGFLLVLLGSSSYDLVLAQPPGTFNLDWQHDNSALLSNSGVA